MTAEQAHEAAAAAIADDVAIAAITDLILEMREAGLQGFSTAPGERTRAILVACVGEAEAQRLWPVR